MSKLFDFSSLAMIPSAYKDGKLYSVRPTDGSGDFTFSRGSNLAATRVDVNGLIEKGRENVLLQSNQFDTTWSAILGAGVTSGQSGYDGSSNAWKLNKASGQSSRIYQNITLSQIVHTTSIYAKADTLRYLAILEFSGSFIYFDLQDGQVGTQSGSPIDVKIEAVGATGWYRCSITDDSTISQLRIYASDTDGSISGSGSIFIQDAQVENSLVATDYIETGTSAAQSGILEDMPRLDYSGGASCPSLLLEPQRSNVVTQSEYLGSYTPERATITDNAATSPEGMLNAASFIETAVSGRHRTQTNSFAVTSGSTYTFSMFVKNKSGNRLLCINADYLFNARSYFDIVDGAVEGTDSGSASIEDYGNGWYRCSVTGTSSITGSSILYIGLEDTAADNGYTGDGTSGHYWYGLQAEAGSYPTSYIPTYGTSQTRSADDFVLVFATDIVQNGGTFMIELEGAPRGAGTSTPFIQFNHTNSASYVGFGATGNWRCRINDNGTAYLTTSPIPHTDNAKLCIRYGDFGYEYYANGSSFDTYGNAIELGDFSNISFSPNDVYGILRVKQFLTFPTALTDAECIALTTL